MLAAAEYSDSSSGSPSPYTPIDPPLGSSSLSNYPPYTHLQDQYIYGVYQPPQVYAPTPLPYEQPSVATYFHDSAAAEPQWSYPAVTASHYNYSPKNHVYSDETHPTPPPNLLSMKPLQLTIPTPSEMLIETTANGNGYPSTGHNNPDVSWDGVHINNDVNTLRRVRRTVSTASFASSTTSSSGASPRARMVTGDFPLPVSATLPSSFPHPLHNNLPPPSNGLPTSVAQGLSNTGSATSTTQNPTSESTSESTLSDLSFPSGVQPNDTISSHEKKRHYLECLEYYVLFLHQQLQLVGALPAQLERADLPKGAHGATGVYNGGLGIPSPCGTSGAGGSKGMSSRSIRTLLVHMKHKNREIDDRISEEEKRYLTLRKLVAEKGTV